MDQKTVQADAYFRNNYSFYDFRKSIFPEVLCDVYLDQKWDQFKNGRLVLVLDAEHLQRYMNALQEYSDKN
jgi:hypothetical protein